MRNSFLFKIFTFLLVCASVLFALTVGGCAKPEVTEKPTITLAEFNWTSQIVLTEIIDQIVNKQMGYSTKRILLAQPPTWAAMDKGEVDISPEIWFPGRQAEIQPFLDKGSVELAGEIFPGGTGWVVPRFVIEGDPARGIEPMAPDLKSILDLKDKDKGGKGYWKLFENPEKPGLGEQVGGSPGWTDDPMDRAIILGYDLPLWRSNQSEAVMMARMIAADKKGQPLLMLIWWPHWIFSEVDLVKLEFPDPWYEGAFPGHTELEEIKPVRAAHPPVSVYKVVRSGLKNDAPDVYRLMQNLVISEDGINALMLRVDVDGEDMAVVAADWINKNQSRIDQWLGK